MVIVYERRGKKQYQVKLTKEDKFLLSSYANIAEGIAKMFGKHCEVALHSLEDTNHSLIKIINGHITGRKVGAPLTDLALEVLTNSERNGEEVIGPYYSTTPSGKTLRSVTILIRNKKNTLIGFLCINFDLSCPLTDLAEFISIDREHNSRGEEIIEHFSGSVEDLLKELYKEYSTQLSKVTGLSPMEKNKLIVSNIYKKGIFNLKGSIETLAQIMGLSKYTVYNYVRGDKKENKMTK